jgi:RNA polymerase sigma-70 factor (ECF subfamily)
MIKSKNQQPHQDDLSHWESSRSGDSNAFSYLFKKYYQPLVRFAGRFLQDNQQANQIVQNVFVDLWVKREQLEIRSSFKSYLYQMTRNQTLNHLKKEAKTVSLEKVSNVPESANKNPDNILVEKEFYIAVHKAIEKLPAKCRQVYVMKRYDQLTSEEVGRILNISVNTVKTQMKRALKSLLDQLGPSLKNLK